MNSWNWNELETIGPSRFGAGPNWQTTVPLEPAPTSTNTPKNQMTTQQQAIIETQTDMRINAVGVSEKTTTLVEYARNRPAHQRGLYLAFNRTVRQEAQTLFTRQGVRNITIHTAHSLAYSKIIKRPQEVLPGGQHTAFAMAEKLKQVASVVRHLPPTRTKPPWPSIAAHCLRKLALYCQDSALTLKEINYNEQLRFEEPNVQQFAHYFDQVIHAGACWVWDQMEQRTCQVSHDYYLKKYQLTNPRLKVDYILFDEGQDANRVMLDIFTKQTQARRVIVGDTHQQIYGFRNAVNSLNQVDFPALSLTKSFRFPPSIAAIAERALAYKLAINPYLDYTPFSPQLLEGVAAEKRLNTGIGPEGSAAIVGRTNLQLVSQAINRLCVEESIGSLYFEGHFDTYTFMDSGVGLMDILLLQQGLGSQAKNPLIRSVSSIEELSTFIQQTGDGQMKTALELVQTYRDELPYFIQQIRNAHLPVQHRQYADLLFSTVHRCKGLEYDYVELCDDFTDKLKLHDQIEVLKQMLDGTLKKDDKPIDPDSLIEEINMLYVAITRSKGLLHLPQTQYELLRPVLQ
jgi:F-box protein 18 (helicase)